MSVFGDAVAQVQELFGEEEGNEFVTDPERCAEAEQVAPCVERFVHGELDPTRRLSPSHTFVPGSPPSLGEKLGKRLERATAAKLGGVRRAICKAVATGYLAYAETEPRSDFEYKPERAPRDVWDFWAPSCRDRLEDTGIPKDWARTVRGKGANSLFADLKALGLTRFLGGSKLNQLGMLYAQAGALLRITQTTAIDDDRFETTLRRVRAEPNRPWKWEDYSV